MKGLQAEHFLYAEPADYFGFYEYDAKEDAHDQVLNILMPARVTFRNARGICVLFPFLFWIKVNGLAEGSVWTLQSRLPKSKTLTLMFAIEGTTNSYWRLSWSYIRHN